MHPNQLRFFEEWIYSEIATEPACKSKKPQENFNDLKTKQEKFSVLQYLRELRFHFQDEKGLVWAVNAYFERVIDLINHVYRIIGNTASATAKIRTAKSYGPALSALHEILSLLELQYGKYMDLNTCLPIPHEVQLKDALVQGFLNFKTSAQAAGVCPVLMETLESVYADFVEPQERGKTTYYRVFYLSAIITSLSKFVPENTADAGTDTAICHALIALNFNSPAFQAHCIQKIQQDPAGLAFAQKEINQINRLPGMALNPLCPPVKETLSTWLTQEISYQERTSTPNVPPAAGKEIAQPRKITTTLSVPQLGNMLKLFTDIGIIVHDNKTELLETIAAMFRTEKTENISAESLRNNYYKDEAATSLSVRDVLITALNKSKGII